MTTHLKSVWFEPQYRARTAELSDKIKEFATYLAEQELGCGLRTRARTIQARKGFGLAVEAVACNLLLMSLTNCGATVAVPRSHGFIWAKGRYANPVYGQHFLDVIDILASLRLVEIVNRGYRLSARHRAPSLVRARDGLADHLPLASLHWTSIHRVSEAEVIILKEGKDADGRSTPLNYPDNKNARQWRRQVQKINEWLLDADIALVGTDSRLDVGTDGQLIIPYRRSLRRIFNNGNWQHGGRLAGGFWMSMKRADRFKRIRLNGEPIVDVDYQQLFPRLAYIRAQEEQPEGDIYDITGDGSCRDGWKLLLNAMLFADGRLGNWPEGARQCFPDGTKLRDAIELLKQKHAPIAHLFETGIGFQLMRIESDMLVAIVTHLFSSGIVALPLHDAVLVARSNAEAAREVMQREFSFISGSRRATVSIDFGPN